MKRVTAVVLATAAVLTLPTAAQAATTFGSRLTHDPANSGECAMLPAPCTIASYINPNANGDPVVSGAPVDGVITKFQIRGYGLDGKAAPVTFRVANVSLQAPPSNDVGLGHAVRTGPTVMVPPSATGIDVPVQEFPGRVPVKQGEHLAIDGTNIAATYNSGGDKFSYKFDQALVDGAAPRASDVATGELLVAASIEADADGDAFGDESQDQCLGQPGPDAGCPVVLNNNQNGRDRTKPVVSNLKVGKRVVRLKLSERAQLTLKVKKSGRGAKTRTIKVQGRAGNNRIKLKSLSRGRYTVSVTARDAAGNQASAQRTSFRVGR